MSNITEIGQTKEAHGASQEGRRVLRSSTQVPNYSPNNKTKCWLLGTTKSGAVDTICIDTGTTERSLI
jgi:hypothetical protein